METAGCLRDQGRTEGWTDGWKRREPGGDGGGREAKRKGWGERREREGRGRIDSRSSTGTTELSCCQLPRQQPAPGPSEVHLGSSPLLAVSREWAVLIIWGNRQVLTCVCRHGKDQETGGGGRQRRRKQLCLKPFLLKPSSFPLRTLSGKGVGAKTSRHI